LDEAHYIRNHNGKRFDLVMRLVAKKKWVVTATPIFNTPKDLYVYFRFLELEGIDSIEAWRQMTRKGGITTYRTINQLVDKHALKIKKEDVLKELTKKNIIIKNVEMTEIEKKFYNSLREYCTKRIVLLNNATQRMATNNPLRRVYNMNILVYILRLKQCCDSPMLVIQTMKRLYTQLSEGSQQDPENIVEATTMLNYYNQSQNTKEECPICYDKESNVICTPCGHKCCRDCMNKLLDFNIFTCSICRSHIDSVKVIDTNEEININDANVNEAQTTINELETGIEQRSSKIQKVIKIIKDKLSIGEKVVIVSQWVQMLNLTREQVDNEINVKSVCLSGKIKAKDRQQMINDFQSDDSIKICYLSLMSSAEGINLTSANNLILLDTWWNNSKMSQVFDRIHRIGQTKQVTIYKLTVNDSIEQSINNLVNKKTKITNLLTSSWTINDEENYDDSWMKGRVNLLERN
jgi:SWI/SNF-related matrix-associated actin-dependent regulator of chromatin subfamily A3